MLTSQSCGLLLFTPTRGADSVKKVLGALIKAILKLRYYPQL
nr:MAG TPA: hypothetical protein [Caudoviricetes sp.]